jgi:flagellar protein FlaG
MNLITPNTVGALVGQPVAQSAIAPNSASPQQTSQAVMPSDAEVVAKVASTVIKPSNVNEASQPTQEVIQKTAQQLQNFVQSMGRDLSFSVDSTTGYHVVRVTNPETGEVIRQLPSEELLKIAESMQHFGNGLVNQVA